MVIEMIAYGVLGLGTFGLGFLLGRWTKTDSLSQSETLTKKITILRKEGLSFLENSLWHYNHGYLALARDMENQSKRMLAEADRLDPPVSSGGEPGRLSLVKDE